jgi:hypothetical protein
MPVLCVYIHIVIRHNPESLHFKEILKKSIKIPIFTACTVIQPREVANALQATVNLRCFLRNYMFYNFLIDLKKYVISSTSLIG